MESLHFEPIGVVHSPYREKFGIPRQPGLVSAARMQLELLPPYNRPEAVKGLEGFSHIWVSFLFHGVIAGKWSPTVRPPRLGGNARVGVFASRSTHRPNPLGLSVVELERIEFDEGVVLHLRGGDLLDGTPVLDIKPYIPYADIIPEARAGFAPEPPETCEVRFSEVAEAALVARADEHPELRELITQLLAQDPRPGYRRGEDEGREYGMRLYDFDLRWRVADGVAEVLALAVD